MTAATIDILSLILSLQIRAEKPYYMADPEVDSLVSSLHFVFVFVIVFVFIFVIVFVDNSPSCFGNENLLFLSLYRALLTEERGKRVCNLLQRFVFITGP